MTKRGKASIRHFCGFKLHLIVNDKGKIFTYMLAPGDVRIQGPCL
ncbi:hypothetical protein NEOC65_001606 [Neochlamydia sp. AcF65]|nr:hypothetical protein [Neochlamydia sp. AcF65]